MSIQYPGNLDSFQNPSANDPEDAPGLEHDIAHANLNDAIKALETKVGVDNSAVTTSVDYFLKHFFTVGDIDPTADPGLPTAFYRNRTTGALFQWADGAWR